MAESPLAPHPRLFIQRDPHDDLRSVAELREDVRTGWPADAWAHLYEQAQQALKAEPILPDAARPGRSDAARAQRNPDYYVCHAAGERLLTTALAFLVTDERRFLDAMMAQATALGDPERWPAWIDQAHLSMGLPADLRTGMLGLALALAYDWAHAGLSAAERAAILEVLDRRAIQPYLAALAVDPWWSRDHNNWLTVVVGGMGIAGMALEGDHPQARQLIDYALPRMEAYLGCYGPDGEFNESPGYAGANRLPVTFFLAHYYWTGGKENRLAQRPFPQMAEWVRQTTLPPGRAMAFGDCKPEQAVHCAYIAAIAAATGDGVLQDFFECYGRGEINNPLALLWYDPRVPARTPTDRPLAQAYSAHGRVVVSRSDGDPWRPACIVYGKAGREENHDHHDAGQLCLDAAGERLIIDGGTPVGYPADFFQTETRWRYPMASVRGHNVFMFDGEEQVDGRTGRAGAVGDVAQPGQCTQFSRVAGVGARWRMDLTAAYRQARRVTRSVLHLWPGYVLVVDEAELREPAEISLRWHTLAPVEPSAEGAFRVPGEKLSAVGQMFVVAGSTPAWRAGRHEYRPPHDRNRLGEPLGQRPESYVEAVAHGTGCRWVTLLAVDPGVDATRGWVRGESGWTFAPAEGEAVLAAWDEQGIALARGPNHRLTLTW